MVFFNLCESGSSSPGRTRTSKGAPMEVRLEHISKKYGSKYALRDFTATLERRSVMKISEIRCPYMAI